MAEFRDMSSAPSPDDFALLGILDHAYVKGVERRGRVIFEVRAADGSPLGDFTDRDTAFAALRLQDMEPKSVH